MAGTGSAFGIGFNLSRIPRSKAVTVIKGTNWLGAVSVVSLGFEGYENIKKYQTGEYSGYEAVGRTALAGIGLIVSAGAAVALTPAAAGLAASIGIAVGAGVLVGLSIKNLEYILYGY